jgi:hypothetical protein
MQQQGMQQQGMQQQGMQQQGMQQQGGLAQQPMQSSAGAKTMIAQPSPFAQGGPQMPQGGPQMPPGMQQGGMQQGGMQPAPQPGPGGFIQASAGQKTIVAGMAPPILNGQMVQQPGQPGQQPGNPYGNPMMPSGYPPGPGGSGAQGPNKTVMLQPSEGVISVARTGQAVQPAGTGAVQQGASTLFWIVSLVIGVAVGALGYVIVLQL